MIFFCWCCLLLVSARHLRILIVFDFVGIADDVNSSFAQQQYADLSSSSSLSLPASVAAAAILQPKNTSNTSK